MSKFHLNFSLPLFNIQSILERFFFLPSFILHRRVEMFSNTFFISFYSFSPCFFFGAKYAEHLLPLWHRMMNIHILMMKTYFPDLIQAHAELKKKIIEIRCLITIWIFLLDVWLHRASSYRRHSIQNIKRYSIQKCIVRNLVSFFHAQLLLPDLWVLYNKIHRSDYDSQDDFKVHIFLLPL